MMKFTLTLTLDQLSNLMTQLDGLATKIVYDGATRELTITESDSANEPAIVDAVVSVTRTADLPPPDEPYIDWLELARKAQREKRQAAALEKADMARIRAKRARQAMAVKI